MFQYLIFVWEMIFIIKLYTMSKFTISENELNKLIYESTMEVLNEVKWGKLARKAAGNALALGLTGPAGLIYKGLYNVGHNKDTMMDAISEKEKGSKSGKDEKSVDKTPKKDVYGKVLKYGDPGVSYPSYCESEFQDTLKGHCVADEDGKKGCVLEKMMKNYVIGLDDRKKEIEKYLKKRDKVFGVSSVSTTTAPVTENIGTAVRVGSAALKLRRQMKKLKKDSNTPVLDYNKKYNMIENEILPVVLKNLCSVLSIEKEDPMYQLITNPQTMKAMMKIIAKEIK